MILKIKIQWNLNLYINDVFSIIFHGVGNIIFWMILFFIFQKTALMIAVEKNNLDIVKLLLSRQDLNVNIKSIFKVI